MRCGHSRSSAVVTESYQSQSMSARNQPAAQCLGDVAGDKLDPPAFGWLPEVCEVLAYELEQVGFIAVVRVTADSFRFAGGDDGISVPDVLGVTFRRRRYLPEDVVDT